MENPNYQNALTPFSLIIIITSICCFLAAAAVFFTRNRTKPNSDSPQRPASPTKTKSFCNCTNGKENCAEMVSSEKQTGLSIMEQLVPEITTHALSYLDFRSLCRLSITNSNMRKLANDDNVWKSLYHKDYTTEQNNTKPANGWKAYYATSRAIMNINAEFYNIIRERSLAQMGHFWLNADYVKCFHASGEFFSGYNGVMDSWQMSFNWEQGVDFQIREVRARVLTDVAWVTMKAYVIDMDTGPFTVTNMFEFVNGRWVMVHHHSSVMQVNGGAGGVGGGGGGGEQQPILVG